MEKTFHLRTNARDEMIEITRELKHGLRRLAYKTES